MNLIFQTMSSFLLFACPKSRAFSSIYASRAVSRISMFEVSRCSSFLHASSSNNAVGNSPSNKKSSSVTGDIYKVETGQKEDYPIVQLYTKEGCTLCDKVSDVLKSLREDHPHSLEAVDITDEDKTEIFAKYKWDIPVLHIDGKYWTKHKLDAEEAKTALTSATNGEFEKQRGEPNAAAQSKNA
mmetsp:Transcript_35187/g.38924  ORF Transcript_35187/g.38924 Transcript_35187/m.38924 type:complete len:184 (-) Transcript_35187:70-621(-)